MKRLLALLLLAAPLAAALPAPLEPACPRWDIVTMVGAGRPQAFDPPCVTVASGSHVVWRNDFSFPVDVRAAAPNASPCFSSREDRGLLESGMTYRVRFTYDGETLLSRWIDPDGVPVDRDCTPLLDATLTTPERGVLHYRDGISQSLILRGVLVVER